jgi:hypothetical protein
MPLPHFTVSQVRVAAACPRILYFDVFHTRAKKLKQPSVTRVWKAGKGEEVTRQVQENLNFFGGKLTPNPHCRAG